MATGGVGDSFVLLPRILGCWGSFARAFLPGRLVFVQLVVQLSGLFERVQAEGAAGVGLLVGVPLHLIDRLSADALDLTFNLENSR